MPYKNDEDRRAFQRARYEQTAAVKQKRDLKRKLQKQYELNEEQRRSGKPLTPMTNITQPHTLAKHGIHVEWDQNIPGVLARPPRDTEGADEQQPASSPLAELKKKLFVAAEKNDEVRVKQTTIEQYWKNFVKIADDLGVPATSLAAAVNKGQFQAKIEELYSNINTIETYVRALFFVVVVCDLLEGVDESAKEDIEDTFEFFKAEKAMEKYRRTIDGTFEVPPFSEIFERALAEVDPASQTAVLLHLYNDLTLRDDYGKVHVYQTRPSVEPKHNYYVRSEGTIYWHNIKKTGHIYGMEAFNYSKETRDAIEHSLTQHPRKKLITKRTYALLRDVGTSVNELRHARISEMYADPSVSRQEKQRLAKEMHHSAATQQLYVRQLRGRIVQKLERL
jgi:hypothetical protein